MTPVYLIGEREFFCFSRTFASDHGIIDRYGWLVHNAAAARRYRGARTLNETIWLEGHISVAAALESKSRPIAGVYLLAAAGDRRRAHIERLAKNADVPVHLVGEAFFDEHASGRTHGGVLAEAGPRRFQDLAALIKYREEPFVVMLDGIEDPFNFGQAVRALYAAGVDGLVVRPRNWLSAASVVARASAGATEWMPTAVSETAQQAAQFFRDQGLVVACTARQSAVSLYKADLTQAMFLLIGGEKRGITRSFLSEADLRLEIPYGRPFAHSLGAAASTAVVAFELLRQRQARAAI